MHALFRSFLQGELVDELAETETAVVSLLSLCTDTRRTDTRRTEMVFSHQQYSRSYIVEQISL